MSSGQLKAWQSVAKICPLTGLPALNACPSAVMKIVCGVEPDSGAGVPGVRRLDANSFMKKIEWASEMSMC